MDSVIDLNMNNTTITLEGISNLIRKTQSTKDLLNNQLSAIDLIVSDHYHALEENEDIFKILRIAISLRKALLKRRNIKTSMAKINPFLNNLISLKSTLETGKDLHYHPRLISEEDILSNKIGECFISSKIKNLSLTDKKDCLQESK